MKNTEDEIKKFVTNVRHIVVGTACASRALKKLVGRLGFTLHPVSRNGHSRLLHPLMGGRAVPFGSSPSAGNWQLAFLREIRHAIRQNPNAVAILSSQNICLSNKK